MTKCAMITPYFDHRSSTGVDGCNRRLKIPTLDIGVPAHFEPDSLAGAAFQKTIDAVIDTCLYFVLFAKVMPYASHQAVFQ